MTLTKLVLIFIIIPIFFSSCKKDNSWEDAVNKLSLELASQKELLKTMQNNLTIVSFENTADGYLLNLSSGQTIRITNGYVPLITVGSNGNWFIDNIDTGKPSQGTNGVSPTVIIGENGHWYINGNDTGVLAEGINGTDGKDGITPAITIGANGHWYINGSDSGVSAIGINGKDGTDGTDGTNGTNGTDGITPTVIIGDNGHWYINGEDTGVCAKGVNGKDGKDGISGTNGKDGTDGVNGKDGVNAPYITSITEVDGTFYFYFSDNSVIYIDASTKYKVLLGKNLLNPSEYVISNSTYNFVKSGYILIEESSSLTASTVDGTLWQMKCELYDKNFKMIKGSQISISSQSQRSVTLNWMDSAKYARFEFRSATTLNQVEKGSNATNYEIYNNNNKELMTSVVPSTIYLLKDNTYSLYFDNIVRKSYQSKINMYLENASMYSRQIVLAPNTAGNTSSLFKVYNNDKVENAGYLNMHTIDGNTFRGKSLRILTIGDSFTDIGQWVIDLKIQLENYGITVSQIGSMGLPDRRHEALSGGTLNNFVLTKSAGVARVIEVTGVVTAPTTGFPGVLYRDATGAQWICRGHKIDGYGKGKMSFASFGVTDMSAFPASGTLTKVDAGKTGDATITYTNAKAAYFNPFWNPATDAMDLQYYLDTWGFEPPDAILLQFTWNDLPYFASEASCQSFISGIKNFIEPIHKAFPNIKIAFSIEPAGCTKTNKGVYFIDGSHYTRMTFAKKAFAEFECNSNYNYFRIAPSYAFVDRENAFNKTTVTPDPLYPGITEVIATDAVHCNSEGMMQIAKCVTPVLLSLFE